MLATCSHMTGGGMGVRACGRVRGGRPAAPRSPRESTGDGPAAARHGVSRPPPHAAQPRPAPAAAHAAARGLAGAFRGCASHSLAGWQAPRTGAGQGDCWSPSKSHPINAVSARVYVTRGFTGVCVFGACVRVRGAGGPCACVYRAIYQRDKRVVARSVYRVRIARGDLRNLNTSQRP